VQCASNEILTFYPPNGSTCAGYMADFISASGGYLAGSSDESSDECRFCTMGDTNAFLESINVNFVLKELMVPPQLQD
jgi:ABC-type multidrug transport system permease subunit